jgi:diaminohydroxyphosphoribosylaminopyrimidine deaminase/5-amino-6-(5-phosphoribosylamino)uracil reductase
MSADDERWMRRCLDLAGRAEGRTAPNPMVGCVIVGPGGEVVAEGYHRRAGTAHAEAVALARVGGRASGCTMYVSLEPCRHTRRRRTAPCAPLVADAGLVRLVVGLGDPIRSHAGGAAWLARQGLAVTRGVLAAEGAEQNRGFVTWARRGRPWLTLKAGISLDGKVATAAGESRWITGAKARREVHRLRDRHDGILVGVGTVLADDPRLTARGVPGGRDPCRIVVDSRLRTPPTAALLPASSGSPARTIVATTMRAPAARERRLTACGAEVWRIPGRGPRVALGALVLRLGQAGLTTVLCEGGPTVHAALLSAGLADEVILYIAPIALGGAGPAWVGGQGLGRLAAVPRFAPLGGPRQVGDDLVVRMRRRVVSR